MNPHILILLVVFILLTCIERSEALKTVKSPKKVPVTPIKLIKTGKKGLSVSNKPVLKKTAVLKKLSLKVTKKSKKLVPKVCFAAPESPQDRRKDKSRLSVANYNVEWLFLERYIGSDCPGDGCPWKTPKHAKKHLEAVADTIQGMGFPDIIHLSEVRSCDVLEALLDQLKRRGEDSYRHYLVNGLDTATGQNVGLITKIDPINNLIRTNERIPLPLAGSQCMDTNSTSQGVSKHYFTRFRVNGQTFVFSGNHFLAFPTRKDRCMKREGQAQLISNALKQHLIEYPMDQTIILGDFNDYDRDVIDAAGEIDTPITRTLEILKSTTSPPLYNIAMGIPDQESRFSSWYDRNGNCIDEAGGEHTLIDHILVSDGFRKKIAKIIPYHSYEQVCQGIVSDHWPFSVVFKVL